MLLGRHFDKKCRLFAVYNIQNCTDIDGFIHHKKSKYSL